MKPVAVIAPEGAAITNLSVINPLGVTLRHYQRELEDVLADGDLTTTVKAFNEPSVAGTSRVRWVLTYIRMIHESRHADRAVVLWPVLGYFDLLILKVLGPRSSLLVMHDPEPLVRAIGYGRLAKRLGTLLRGTVLITHSRAATAAAEADGFSTSLVPHPVLRPDDDKRPSRREGGSNVRVLGQFKRDRDLGLLQGIATELQGEKPLSVHGRGWPRIPGWAVQDEFVAEDVMDELIRTSLVILIPYRRFFQSGIAVRALECGTPVVGPRDSWLAELTPDLAPALPTVMSGSAWAHAIRRSTETTSDLGQAHVRAFVEARAGWHGLLTSKS
ncbi:hypothetical protein [Nocardioides pacificus]